MAKKQSKNRAFEPKKQSKTVFFTYSFTSATKIPKKISGCHWGSINVVILILNQIPRPPVRIFWLNNQPTGQHAVDSLEFHWRTLAPFVLELYLSSTGELKFHWSSWGFSWTWPSCATARGISSIHTEST